MLIKYRGFDPLKDGLKFILLNG